jgi:hypothetical protein
MSFNGARHELEIRADIARDRLLETIDAIDRRRHDVLDWKLQLREHVGRIAFGSAALMGGVALAVAVRVLRARLSAAHRRQERFRALTRAWEHPERVATRQRRPVRAMMLSAASAIALLAVARLVGPRG